MFLPCLTSTLLILHKSPVSDFFIFFIDTCFSFFALLKQIIFPLKSVDCSLSFVLGYQPTPSILQSLTSDILWNCSLSSIFLTYIGFRTLFTFWSTKYIISTSISIAHSTVVGFANFAIITASQRFSRLCQNDSGPHFQDSTYKCKDYFLQFFFIPYCYLPLKCTLKNVEAKICEVKVPLNLNSFGGVIGLCLIVPIGTASSSLSVLWDTLVSLSGRNESLKWLLCIMP